MDADFTIPDNSNYPPEKPTRLQNNLPDLPSPPLDSRNDKLIKQTDLGVSVLQSSNNFSAPPASGTDDTRPRPLAGEVSTEANPVASVQPQVSNVVASALRDENLAAQINYMTANADIAEPVIGQFEAPLGPNQKPVVFSSTIEPKHSRGKKLTLLASLLILITGAAAAAYLGFIVPNKPQNIWNRSWANMGIGYDHLISYSSDIQKTTKGLNIKGSYQAEGSFTGSGTIDSSTYNANAAFKIGLDLAKGPLSFELRSIAVPSSKYPDIYLKFGGIKSLDLPASAYDSLINSIDGKWISIDHTYTNQVSGASDQTTENKLTTQDVTDFQKAFNTVNKQWLFTDNAGHQVIQIKQNIGKEKQDNRPVYHYKAQINKQNLKSYAKALRDGLKNTKLAKAYFPKIGDSSDADINKSVDHMDTPPNIDVWADTHTKLIHKFRIGEANNNFEVSQDYQGGNQFPFSLSFFDKSDKSETTSHLTGTLDMESNTSKIQFDFKSSKQKISGQLEISRNNDPTQVDKPTSTISIQDLMVGLIGMDSSNSRASAAPTSASAKDSERKNDIKAIQGLLEVYYAQNGFYPTFANINDKNWLATNAPGVDTNSLKDPDGTNSKFSSKPAAHTYAYDVTANDGKNCNNTPGKECNKYTLTAILSDGSKFVVSSLN